MATGDHDAQVGVFDFLTGQEGGFQVSFEVVYADQGQVPGPGQSLGGGDTDKECSDQSRAVGDGYRIQIFRSQTGLLQGVLDDTGQLFEMAAAGDLGNDSAIRLMFLDL